jgi:uncharacterized peroxidase-related enzyme
LQEISIEVRKGVLNQLSYNRRRISVSRIGLLSAESAGGDAAAILKEIEAAFGMVPNLFKAYAYHPPLLEANWNKVKAVMMQGNLSRKLKETIAVAVSRDNGCSYCVAAHTAALKSIGVTDTELKAIEEDIDKTDFSAKEKALLGFVRKANKDPLNITDAEFKALQATGAGKAEIVEALGVMEVFTAFNKFLDSLQVELDF